MKAPVAASILVALGVAALGAALSQGVGGLTRRPPLHYGETRVVGAEFPKGLVSGDARQVIQRAPSRIASLTVTGDEILTRIADPDRILAVTPFADDPSIATCAGHVPPRAARIRGIDPESVIALEPDLVLVAHYTLESAVRILNAATIPVVRLRNTRSFDDVAANVLLAAAVIGEEARAEAVLTEMRQRLDRVAARVRGRPRPRVLYYSAIGYTSGAGTLIDEKIRRAGGANAAAEAALAGFESVSLDLLVGLDPDVIVVPRWSADEATPVREVTESRFWRDVHAVRTGRVHAVAASALTSESPDGVRGVEELARLFHAEAFSS